MRLRLIFVLTILGSFLAEMAHSQSAKTEFGRNRLQYKQFNWRYYSSSNFDIYFYDDGEALAKLSAEYMEEAYSDITELVGYSPYSKTKIFLYNSIADLQQSNVGVNQSPFTVGGQANFVKTQVEVAFPGTLYGFKEELKYEVTKALVMDMMFGGNLRDVFQSAYLLTLPDWYIEGIARYIAYGWDVEMDDYVRVTENLRSNNLKLYRLQGRDAHLMGQAIWNYIAEKHGRASLSNILNYTRIVRNGETAITNTLGLPFRTFINRLKEFYLPAADKELAEYSALPKEAVIAKGKKTSRDNAFNSLAINPSGSKLAYSINNRGRYHIQVKNTATGKTKTVLKTGYKALDQELDDTIPLLAWQDSVNLGVISVQRGQYVLLLINTKTGKSTNYEVRKVSQVNDFSFSPNGKVAVMSAEKEGRNDIYLYSLSRRSLTAITNDWYDDITPTFIPGTNNIVFSSNRTTDSLNRSSRIPLKDIEGTYNLFLYNVDTTDKVLAKLTNVVGKNYKPKADGNRNLYFISNQKGIANLYRYGLDNGLTVQITSNAVSYSDYSINPKTSSIAYISRLEGEERVFYQPSVSFSDNNFTGPTRRQSIWQIRYVKELAEKKKIEEREQQLKDSVQQINRKVEVDAATSDSLANTVEPGDTLTTDSTTQNSQADSLATIPATTDSLEVGSVLVQQEENLIDPENYEFDKPAATATVSKPSIVQNRRPALVKSRESFLSSYRRNRKKEEMKGPFKMEPRFLINSFTLTFGFDPLRASLNATRANSSPFFGGLGIKLETHISDLLENQKFYGGAFLMTNLRSGTVFAEYEYLKHFIDFRVRYDRSVVIDRFPFVGITADADKYVLDMGQASLLFPLSHNVRLETGGLIANTQYLPLFQFRDVSSYPNLKARSTFMGGGQAKLVFDNTQVLDFNILNGSRGYLHLTHLSGINNSDQGFTKVLLDFRRYQRISRNITLAGRAYYGRFFGSNAPYFILGGVDNQLASSTNISSRPNNPYFEPVSIPSEPSGYHSDNRNLLFYDFAVPLRGQRYNAMYGTNAMLFNLELRVPIVQYFYRGPITSNFFRNLQFVGFVDTGTAWSGSAWYPKDGANSGPLEQSADDNTDGVPTTGSPFDITVTDYSNPWIAGYGGGIRTVILGYYAKFDLAWPMEDYKIGEPRLHVSLGFDF